MPAKGEKRKQQIIETAKEMFIKNGYKSTHIGQICEELDIARGTVYQYFGNKREILFAFFDNAQENIEDILDVDDLNEFFVISRTENEIRDFLINRLTESLNTVLQEPIIFKILFKEISGTDKNVEDKASSFLDSIAGLLVRDSEILIEKGLSINQDLLELKATMVIGGMLMLVRDYERKGKNVLEPVVIQTVVDDYMLGILKEK